MHRRLVTGVIFTTGQPCLPGYRFMHPPWRVKIDQFSKSSQRPLIPGVPDIARLMRPIVAMGAFLARHNAISGAVGG